MLDHLRRRAGAIMAAADTVTLVSDGPAGLQARPLRCETHGLDLYLLLPGTSDHLLNLEAGGTVLACADGWQLRGAAQMLPQRESPAGLRLPRLPEAAGCVIVRIQPLRLHIYRENAWGFSETLDFESSPIPDPKPDF